ncbi:MAG TPA: hypothetical protein PKI86_00495 [Chitinophagales bacterium]|nr:hypothetical protein [Chitinophagales bacterium]
MDKWFTHDDPVQFLFLNDLLLAPIFLFIVYSLAKSYIVNKKNPIYKKYFMNALIVRFASAILMALVYQYYYDGGGDTHTYFTYSLRIREVFYESKSAFLHFVFLPPNDTFLAEKYFGVGAAFFTDNSSNIIIRLSLILSYPLGNSYILISFVFTLFCFYGCWKIFSLFHHLYPHLEKEFALACLFLPSVCFWGTGILKDPICLGALGTVTYHVYKLFFEKTKVAKRLFIIIICFWLLKVIKVYILLSFMPAYSFWIIFRYKETINSKVLKSMIAPLIFVTSVVFGSYILHKIAAFSERYSLDSIVRTAKDTQNWLYYSSQIQGGSGYSFGNIEYTPLGILKVLPKAINVALFRPYLWEARKPILIPAAIEGLISLFFTIRLLYKAGFTQLIKLVFSNPEVQFCLVFSIIFAFSVGFTSYNFGALARYKIPMMPFYYIALFILADKEKTPEHSKKTTGVKLKPSALIPKIG